VPPVLLLLFSGGFSFFNYSVDTCNSLLTLDFPLDFPLRDCREAAGLYFLPSPFISPLPLPLKQLLRFLCMSLPCFFFFLCNEVSASLKYEFNFFFIRSSFFSFSSWRLRVPLYYFSPPFSSEIFVGTDSDYFNLSSSFWNSDEWSVCPQF